DTCMPAHAVASCVLGACVAGRCAPGWADCNKSEEDGCETYLRFDANNCTMCGMACALPHARQACSGGCYIAACDFGFEDCNSAPEAGCEVGVLSDTRNCGRCANACPGVARAVVGCSFGACTIQSCSQGFGDCNKNFNDGCEVSLLTDRTNCAACGA